MNLIKLVLLLRPSGLPQTNLRSLAVRGQSWAICNTWLQLPFLRASEVLGHASVVQMLKFFKKDKATATSLRAEPERACQTAPALDVVPLEVIRLPVLSREWGKRL